MLTGSVSAAARSHFRTQPTVSASIASLEDEIGYRLFERRGRRLYPEPEAYFLFEEAKAIIDRLDSAERTVKEVRRLERGTINIAAMLGPSISLLPISFPGFSRAATGSRSRWSRAARYRWNA